MKILVLLLTYLFSVTMLWSAVIEPGDSAKRHKTDYTISWTPAEEQTYTVGATASGCSFVDSKTKANGDAILKSHSTTSASAEKKITHTEIPSTAGFGFSVSGVLAGSGSGGELTWSATLQQKFFWLTPVEKIVAEGTDVTVTANGAPTESTWQVNSKVWKDWNTANSDPHKTSSITLNRNMWDKMKWTPTTIPAGWECPPAGVYNISATTTEEQDDRSAGATIYVVKINTSATDLFGNVAQNDDGSNKTAYVHWNIDNDNNASGGTLKHPGGDYFKTATIAGEDDLKSFTLSLYPMVNKGSIEISVGDNGKVWKSATKTPTPGATSALLLDAGASKTWDLSNEVERNAFSSLGIFYMEGIGDGSTTFIIKYKNEKGTEVTSDSINYTFIAANCGDQPTVLEKQPHADSIGNPAFTLTSCEWSITGEKSTIYNCIAWSLGLTNTWINPDSFGVPVMQLDQNPTEAQAIAFYVNKGYIKCSKADAQVYYYMSYHAAINKGCSCGGGKWTMLESKCGRLERVEHKIEELNYGYPTLFFKK